MSRRVLVCGGTRGIGLAIGQAFARHGDSVVLTHRWGSVTDQEILAEFSTIDGPAPQIIEADVANDDDTRHLLETIGEVDVLVANVCVAGKGDGQFHARTLRQSLAHSAWPLLKYVTAMRDAFGRPPRHIIATSSDGPDHFYPGYDYVAASKSLLESICRALQSDFPQSRVNAVRARQVDTTSYREMFDESAREKIARFSEFDLAPDEVARAVYQLCEPDLDGLRGQTMVLDRGATRWDNITNIAPRLLTDDDHRDTLPSGRKPGLLVVTNREDIPTIHPDMTTINFSQLATLNGDAVPDSVVVEIDWDTVLLEDVEQVASALVSVFQLALDDGCLPRYGVQIDSGTGVGRELSRTLARYRNGWSAGTDSRINFVQGEGPSVWNATRALLGGALDALNGHVLEIT